MNTSNVIQFKKQTTSLTLGLPVISRFGQREGYIVDVRETKNKTCMRVGSAMKPETHEYQIAWCDAENKPHSLEWLLESMVLDFAERAANYHLQSITELEIVYYKTGASAAEMARRRECQQAQIQKNMERASFLLEAEDKFNEATEAFGKEPQAVIIAEYMVDESDSMTDYFASRPTKTIILAFSKHTRDLFPEMRKAALNAQETKHLFAAPEEAENREKYSRGGGYYLKENGQHRTGWKISKARLYKNAESIPTGTWALQESKNEIVKPQDQAINTHENNGLFQIEEHTHTKKGFQMFIAIPQERLSRDAFLAAKSEAVKREGWYSRQWGKTPGGFAFLTLEAAQDFVALYNPETDPEGGKPTQSENQNQIQETTAQTTKSKKDLSEKFNDLADKMQDQIDHKLNDNRLTNTPKRQKEAAYARQDGQHLKRTQQALRILAKLHAENNVPQELENLKSKKAIHDLTKTKIDHSNCGYYDAGRDTGEPYLNTPEAKTLWSLLSGPSVEEQKTEDLRREIESLTFKNIAGYFPTQKMTVQKMLSYAQIEKGMRILEPEAGSGYIADELGEGVECCEINYTLREILKKKGHFVIGDDFLSMTPTPIYDRIVMNPPFENGQDIDHVQHAFQFLKSGGRLVAITSQGAFFHSTKKAKAFQYWVNNVVEHMEDLPAGEFKESGTQVSSKLIVLTK